MGIGVTEILESSGSLFHFARYRDVFFISLSVLY